MFLIFSLSHTHLLLNRRKRASHKCVAIFSLALSHTHSLTHTQATQSQETGIPNVLQVSRLLSLTHTHTQTTQSQKTGISNMLYLFALSLSHTHTYTHTGYSIARNGDPKCVAFSYLLSLTHTHTQTTQSQEMGIPSVLRMAHIIIQANVLKRHVPRMIRPHTGPCRRRQPQKLGSM